MFLAKKLDQLMLQIIFRPYYVALYDLSLE